MLITPRALALALVCISGTAATLALAQATGATGGSAAGPAKASAGSAPVAPPHSPDEVPGLTPQQREQIAALQRRTQQKLAPQREQLQAKCQELHALWLAEPPSEPAILKKLAQLDAIRSAMRPALVQSRIAHLGLLTREQRLALGQPHPSHPGRHQTRPMQGPHAQARHSTRPEDGMSCNEARYGWALGCEGGAELGTMSCAAHQPHVGRHEVH